MGRAEMAVGVVLVGCARYMSLTSAIVLESVTVCQWWGKGVGSVGQLNENPVHKYELLVFNIDEIELLVFIGVENEQLVFNGIENAHLLYPLNSPFRINIWGGGGKSITGFIANEDFWSPPPLP